MSLSQKLGVKNRVIGDTGPLWAGPEGGGPNGGVSQSLLGRFLVCRERFRLYAIEGLAPYDSFSAPLEYGSMFHLCVESARNAKGKGSSAWHEPLLDYTRELQKRYQLDADKVAHWYQMCLVQFPEYLKFWADDRNDRRVLETEETFDVKYTLPWSKRVVRLRGKRDGLSLLDGKVWLDENKTKSQIDQKKISRSLRFDLQTMMYLVAINEERSYLGDNNLKARTSYRQGGYRHFHPIGGVLYNVVRRSAHKTTDSMLKKMEEDIADGRGAEWFAKWCVPIGEGHVERFKTRCLDPILEWLCIWYEAVTNAKSITHLNATHLRELMNYQHPYGVYNVLDEGGSSEYDEYLENGSLVGLRKMKTLFPELTPAA